MFDAHIKGSFINNYQLPSLVVFCHPNITFKSITLTIKGVALLRSISKH